MRFCKRCVQPDTRPGIFLDERGVCSGCLGHEEKVKKINWQVRRQELDDILKRFRCKDGSYYDCVVPVSGGKDSMYQVFTMKEQFGMRPLAVTYHYSDRTALGKKNLEALRNLGVDHIDISPNPNVEKRFIKKALFEAGDPCVPDHTGMFIAPIRVALNYKIPLIVWGENPQLEYGGPAADRNNPYLNRGWLQKNGCLGGRMAEGWVDDTLSLGDLWCYRLPTDEELIQGKITSIFLGYYVSWDPVKSYEAVKNLGFQKSPDGPKMGIYDFADLDSTNMIVHHYFKLVKFGMSRLNDNISVEIRHGRMTRAQGVKILKERTERVPLEEIRLLCKQIDITEGEFWAILEKFRNKDIWKKDAKGNWHIPGYLEALDEA